METIKKLLTNIVGSKVTSIIGLLIIVVVGAGLATGKLTQEQAAMLIGALSGAGFLVANEK